MKKGISQLIAIVLVAAIAFGCGFCGAYAFNYLSAKGYITSNNAAAPGEPGTIPAGTVSINVDNEITVAEAVAAKVMPSVVGVSTVITQNYSSGGFFGFNFGWGGGGGTYDSTAVGTGVIVDTAGYILTNSHVVNDGDAKSITVSLYDGSNVPGEILWNDASLDLAVVKIEPTGSLVAADLGDSDKINIGSYAAAIGNPLGLNYERSMSQGIISGLNRSITVSNGSGGFTSSASTMEGLMQTDATINSGNSGGPLLNSKGEVIGINTAKASSGEGMGFAIPINVAKPIVESVKATGSYERPYLGISGVSLQEQNQYSRETLLEQFGIDKGIYVAAVTAGSGAEAAGLEKGDVIIKVNGLEVGTMNKLNTVLVKYGIGETVEVTYMRDKMELTTEVELKGSAIFDTEGEKH